MSFTLNQHMVSDKRKWAFVFTAIALVIVFLVVMVWSSFFTEWNRYCWDWAFFGGHKYDDNGICVRCGAEKLDEVKPTDNAAVNGGAMLTVPEGQNGNMEVKFMSLAGSADLPAAIAANSWTISVTKVTPSSADNQRFDFEMKWENANSTWANGKLVTDYATLTHSDGAKEATFQNLKDFGEPILIVVTSQDNPSLSKSVKVDYVQKITGFTFTSPDISSETTTFTYTVETSAYTIASQISFEFGNTIELSQAFQDSFDTYMTDIAQYYCLTANLVKNGDKSFTISQNTTGVPSQFDYYPDGLIGMFVAVNSNDFFHSGADYGDVIVAFRDAVDDCDGMAQAEFTVTYKAVYNGQTYSSGSQKVGVQFDGASLHVAIEDFTLNIDHLVI